MRFLYHPDAGLPALAIEGESYRYLFKVRRYKRGDIVAMRNLQDDYISFYRIDSVSKKEAGLILVQKEERIVMAERYLHIGWCIVDPRVVEKTLPTLNELGVSKLSLVYCARSQKNFRVDTKRLHRILINSSQQCGRSRLLELEFFESTEEYFLKYPHSAVLDFGGMPLACETKVDSILIGCEGGFCEEERKFFENLTVYGLDTPLVLRSESAAVSVASKIVFG